jgi:hypothetical protein
VVQGNRIAPPTENFAFPEGIDLGKLARAGHGARENRQHKGVDANGRRAQTVVPDVRPREIPDIRLPETIDRPAYDRYRPEFNPVREEPGELPLPDEIDPSRIPGSGCPNGRPPGGHAPVFGHPNHSDWLHKWRKYWETQEEFDVFHQIDPDDASPGELYKWRSVQDSLFTRPEKDTSGKDTGSQTDDGKDTTGINEDVKDKPVDYGADGGKPPIGKDPEPEGDDPDEILSPAGRDAPMVQYFRRPPQHQPASGPSGQEDSDDEGWRQPWHGRPLVPRIDRPDFGAWPQSGNSRPFDGAAAGYTHQPPPDDPDSPVGPRASDGSTRVDGVTQQAASPPENGDGDDGGGPLPPNAGPVERATGAFSE